MFQTLELDIDITELEDADVVPDDLSGEEGYYTRSIERIREDDPDLLLCLADEVNTALGVKYKVYSERCICMR